MKPEELDKAQIEITWLRTVFLAGATAMREDLETNPSHDLWEHTTGARLELRFKHWLLGVVGP